MGERVLQSQALKMKGLGVWVLFLEITCFLFLEDPFNLFSTKYSMKNSKHNKLLMNYMDDTFKVYRGMYD